MALRSDGDSVAQRSSRLRHAAIVVIALGASACALAVAAPVDDLRTAVEAGDSAAAYARHCATSIDAPDRPPEFDLWCGVAAVDIGRSGEGVHRSPTFTFSSGRMMRSQSASLVPRAPKCSSSQLRPSSLGSFGFCAYAHCRAAPLPLTVSTAPTRL